MPDWCAVLLTLQQEHPTAHAYTLALLLEVRTGRRFSGQAIASVLKQQQTSSTD
jgi:hypothetical protein